MKLDHVAEDAVPQNAVLLVERERTMITPTEWFVEKKSLVERSKEVDVTAKKDHMLVWLTFRLRGISMHLSGKSVHLGSRKSIIVDVIDVPEEVLVRDHC